MSTIPNSDETSDVTHPYPGFSLKNPGTVLILAWVIFTAAFGLRIQNLGDYPQRHATDDEFHYLWAGLNFWDSGRTATWSGLKGSAVNRIGVAGLDDMGYIIVSPSYDHPPLFTLLSGATARLFNPERINQVSPYGGRTTIWDIDLNRARWMMMPVFAATFWLLFALARTAYSPGIALLTVLIYGFMSHAVAQGRLILADNLAALILVANAWAIQRWLKGQGSHRSMAGWTIGLTAAAILTKVPAACQVPALIAMFIAAQRPREIRYVLYGFVLGCVVYLAWLSWFGLDGFFAAMASQAERFRGFNAFQLMSGVPRLLDIRDLNGLVIAGWFCLLIQAFRPDPKPVMAVPLAYMLTFTFFAGDVLFGWYSLPLFPWLAMTLAVTTAKVFHRPAGIMGMAWLLLLLPVAFQSVFLVHESWVNALRYGYALVVAVLLFGMLLQKDRAIQLLRIAMILVLGTVLIREVGEIIYQRKDRVSDQDKYLN